MLKKIDNTICPKCGEKKGRVATVCINCKRGYEIQYCKICGKKFRTRDKRIKTCSPECSSLNSRYIKKLEWQTLKNQV